MKPLRVGLVGAGMIGQLRARALAQVTELRLEAIADPCGERAGACLRHARGARLFPDGLTLAADPELDAVIVSTPPHLHEPIALACLAAGKHVLCEKPLACTVAGCEALVAAARRAGVSLGTGFNLRYTRAALLARRLLDEGAIGELDHVRAFHGHPCGKELTHPWVHDRAVSGGGTLMDNGIHLIDLTRWFLGGVAEVRGHASGHTWQVPGCEDNGFLLLKNARNRVGTLQASWTEWRGYQYRVEVYGTRGFIRFGYPPLYLVHGRVRADGTVQVRRHWFPAYQMLERVLGWQWGLRETLVREMQAWGRALLGGSPPPVSGADGLEAVRIARSVEVLAA
jgi:predicted dehydrogenase